MTQHLDDSDQRIRKVIDIINSEYRQPTIAITDFDTDIDIRISKYVADPDEPNPDIDPDYVCYTVSVNVLVNEFTAIVAVLLGRLLWLIMFPFAVVRHGWASHIDRYNTIHFNGRDENDDVFLQLVYVEEDDPNTPLFQYIDRNFEFEG